MDAPIVTLAGLTVTLRRPSPLFSVAIPNDAERIANADPAQIIAWCAASLFACWPDDVAWPVNPRPRHWTPGIKLEKQGHDLFDSLVLSGLDPTEVIQAAGKAHVFARVSLVSGQEVQAARDFSEAPKGG